MNFRLFAGVVAGGLLLNASVATAAGKKLLIGSSGGITGPAASIIGPIFDGIKDYCKYAVAEKVLGPKYDPTCTLLDDGFKPQEFRRNIEKLMDEGLVFIVGGSPHAFGPMKNDLTKEGIAAFPDAPDLMNVSSPAMYATIPTLSVQSIALLEYIKKNHKGAGKPKVGFTYFEQGEASRQWEEHVKEAAKFYDIDLIESVSHTATELDQTATLKRLYDKGARYLLVMGIQYTASIFVKNLNTMGLLASEFGQADKMSVVKNMFSGGSTFVELAGGIGNGIIMSSSLAPATAFATKLGQANKREPTIYNSLMYALGVHDAQLAFAAMAHADKTAGSITKKTIVEALNTMPPVKTEISLVPVKFTAANHQGVAEVPLFVLKNGKYEVLGQPFLPEAAKAIAARYGVEGAK